MQSNDTMKNVHNSADQCLICAKPEITDRHEVRMRWFILVVIAISLLASLAASIILTLMMRNPVALTLPSSVLLIVLPIIRFLFPPTREKRAKNDAPS